MLILVVAALAVILAAVPAFAGQAGAATGSATHTSEGGGAQAQTRVQEQVQSQDRTGECAQDCMDCPIEDCDQEQLRTRTRIETRVGENPEPAGEVVRDRTRLRVSQPSTASADASMSARSDLASMVASGMPEPPVEPAARATERVLHSIPAGILAWVRSMLAFIGLG